jgi:hypothetical protein
MDDVARPEDPTSNDEPRMLREWLSFYRGMIAWKSRGLSRDQLIASAVPPSHLSLLGLVRHLSEMERAYLRNGVGGASLPLIYCTEQEPDGDFDGVRDADPDAVFATWREECARADDAIDAAPSPDTRGQSARSLRWYLVKVIGEYARHTGHADLIRERIDGVTGD